MESRASPASQSAKTKIPFTGTQETLLITLYGRYLDFIAPEPLLGDKWPGLILEHVDYDFAKLGVRAGSAAAVATRSKLFDGYVNNFLANHPSVTVLHLACGLDTRPQRLQWGEGVRWIDVDLPDVVELRKKLVPEPEGNRDYTLLAGSATDPDFIATLPNDRPTIIIMEGLTFYLEPEDGQAMISHLCNRFKTGEMAMDSLGWLAIFFQRLISYTRNTSSTLRWSIDTPKALEEIHPDLKVIDEIPLCTMDEVAKFPPVGRFFMWISKFFSATRGFIRYLHYSF